MSNHDIPTIGSIYAVHHGQYAGEMMLFVKTTATTHNFLAIPTKKNRHVPFESYELARSNDILRYVETVPDDVYRVCLALYEQNESAKD